VLRVLTTKYRMGLFDHPYALTGTDLVRTFHHAGDDAVSLRSARESIILLHNDGTLPLGIVARRRTPRQITRPSLRRRSRRQLENRNVRQSSLERFRRGASATGMDS